MDNKGFMGPRFAGMPQMMPLKADGTEMTEGCSMLDPCRGQLA